MYLGFMQICLMPQLEKSLYKTITRTLELWGKTQYSHENRNQILKRTRKQEGIVTTSITNSLKSICSEECRREIKWQF